MVVRIATTRARRQDKKHLADTYITQITIDMEISRSENKGKFQMVALFVIPAYTIMSKMVMVLWLRVVEWCSIVSAYVHPAILSLKWGMFGKHTTS